MSRRGAIRQFGHKAKWRWRWTVLAFGAGAGASWVFRKEIFRWLIAPAEGYLSPFPGGPPVFFAPADIFTTSFKLAIYGGLVAALPVFFTGFYLLISQHLPQRVRLLVGFTVPATVLLFIVGVAFVYYVMLPVSIRFLLNFGEGVAVPLISINEYLGLLIALMFWVGVVFDLPVLMYVLARSGVVPYRRFRRVPKRIVVAAAAIMATLITPTFDLVNWAMVGLPIIALWEAGLFASWLADPQGEDYMGVRRGWLTATWLPRKVNQVLEWLRVWWTVNMIGRGLWQIARLAMRLPWQAWLGVTLAELVSVAVWWYWTVL